MSKIISEAVIRRLPKYYRYLVDLELKGETKVSSVRFAEMLGITASQVRQDFCNFGGFGQQGYGYDVSNLRTEIAKILGLDKSYNMIIIGAGNIGRAIASYRGFGIAFDVIGAFDVICRTDTIASNIPLLHIDKLDSFVNQNKVDVAVIATQKDAAQAVAEKLYELNIKNIWNFAPVDLKIKDNVVVENVYLSESLSVLSYKMKNN